MLRMKRQKISYPLDLSFKHSSVPNFAISNTDERKTHSFSTTPRRMVFISGIPDPIAWGATR